MFTMLAVVTEVNSISRSASSPTHRQRRRAATRDEIVEAARTLLVQSGLEQVTLRGIAGELGMTAPALYRYFDSREALLEALIDALYDELADILLAVRDADAHAPLKAQFVTTSREFRRWALTHRPEFGLLFGAPLPGVAGKDVVTAPDRGMRFGQVWLELFAKLSREHPEVVPDGRRVDPQLRRQLREYHELIGRAVPIGTLELFLSCWMRLYGAVATEAFGHLNFALSDGNAEALFEGLLGEMADRLGLAH
jgi:AcrR family transcriptional regulator